MELLRARGIGSLNRRLNSLRNSENTFMQRSRRVLRYPKDDG